VNKMGLARRIMRKGFFETAPSIRHRVLRSIRKSGFASIGWFSGGCWYEVGKSIGWRSGAVKIQRMMNEGLCFGRIGLG
jgi:hypothetical protein